jgi:hypothetical protein|tara:strand:+ start:9210 stop:9575 length:366 start_codon:yes stop_codon:yes gene_type:complete
MRKIPPDLLKQILNDPYYKKCIRHKEKACEGRITLEHTFIYAGRQINEKWSIVPLCAKHHEVDQFQDAGTMDKEYGQYIALTRATDEDLAKYPRKNWQQRKKYLYSKYEDRNTDTKKGIYK